MHTNSENRWSPFDPEWYQQAFDKFISTADRLFNEQDIIDAGYVIPDADGSKSSVFRNEAVLNNSFNEEALRETLKDIYLNSSHKLVASNHDNVRFYKWNGTMKDVKFISNTNMCEIVLPTESFITRNREKFKLSQFYRKWITAADLMDNWDVFKWACMLFINQRPYSDYQLRIDEQETTIRFTYQEFWKGKNYPIYVYKFDTNAHCRVKITRNQVINKWDWKIPVEYIDDKRIMNSTRVIGVFSRTFDGRDDLIKTVDPMSDNIEFLHIEDGYIDISNISDANKAIINSEPKEWLILTLIVPKYLHEFPIPLPVDVLYRSYRSDFVEVKSIDNGTWYTDKSIEDDKTRKKIYVNLDNNMESWNDGWKYMIRPVVLSDAFVEEKDAYSVVDSELDILRELTTKTADQIEEFRWFMVNYTTDNEFLAYCDDLETNVKDLYDAYNSFLARRWMEENEEYDKLYEEFVELMPIVREYKKSYSGFNRQHTKENDFWAFISPLVWIPQKLLDKYGVISILRQINNEVLWEDKLTDVIRFKRPIEASDFWTFEYDHNENVWRLYILDVERLYPDAYLFNDSNEEEVSLNRVFKALFFYSDNMSVTKPTSELVRPSGSWDSDMELYEYEYGASYRDIFMEKFYWMGIKSVYDGLLQTDYKWEVLEYVIDNVSYERFNELFLKTMDPYFKMGLATYLKSSNYEFPFDDAIDKMSESIKTKFIGYQRITNFERYLNNTWVPQYFDYVAKILDNWDYSSRLIRRPRSTFDTTRFLPTLISIQNVISESTTTLNEALDWILNELSKDEYTIKTSNIKDLRSLTSDIESNINAVLGFTQNLDLDIYSVEDVNYIIELLEKHKSLVENIHALFEEIYRDAVENAKYEEKKLVATEIHSFITNEIKISIENVISASVSFNIDSFMKITNDPEYFNEIRDNMKDRSLIGLMNRFKTAWPDEIKELRNKLYTSTTSFMAMFDSSKSYTTSELNNLLSTATNIRTIVSTLNEKISAWWIVSKLTIDDAIVDALNDVFTMINDFVISLTSYIECRDLYIDKADELRIKMVSLVEFDLSPTEESYIELIDETLNSILVSISFVVGINVDTTDQYEEIKEASENELAFIAHEKEIFEKIILISNDENDFYVMVNEYRELIEAMISYMRTVDREFIADSQNPSYSIVYQPTSVKLITGGFGHNEGDVAYAPQLGVFKITEVDGNISEAKAINCLGYRNTIFRDPTWQANNPYDTITSGSGMGLSIKAIESDEIRIINDNVIDTYAERIKNIVYLTKRDITTINPYSNIGIADIITKIESIVSDWNDILSFYSDYMSDGMKSYMNTLIDAVEALKDPLNNLIEIRNNNDLSGFLKLLNSLINTAYKYSSDNDMLTPTFVYFDNRLRTHYSKIEEFYGNGSDWNDPNELKDLLDESEYELKLYKRKALENITEESIITLYNECLDKVNTIRDNLVVTADQQAFIVPIYENIETELEDEYEKQVDSWYNLTTVTVGSEGTGYSVGDIVQIIPELPTDINGNPIHDQEDLIMNDKLFLQITHVNDNGGVTSLIPLLDYAVPYKVWGSRKTITCVGNGEGLVISAFSYEITLKDSTLFLDPSSDPIQVDQFDKNDMFTFKFENIHDLDITYEVFFAGKQIHDFIIRHEDDINQLHPRKMDVIYLNANEVYELRNSSIYIQGEHYIVYKLESIEIIDPGAGYARGQEITVNTDQIALRLKVAKLLYGPTKGIEEIEMVENYTVFNGADPTSENASAADDSLNNIDDEYNNGYYDKLTSEGITKGATRGLDPDEYSFTSHRFDDIPGGNRNSSYMYPDIEANEDTPEHGDPDYNFYLGSRISESHKWNGIMNTQPPTEGVIDFNDRTPHSTEVDLPLNGEYQEIARERICTTMMKSQMNNTNIITGDLEVETYEDLPKTADDWPEVNVGKYVIVKCDETNGGHRTVYRVRTFVIRGFIVYNDPEIVDYEWKYFDIDWMNIDFYPDIPTLKAQYPDAPWYTAKSYREVLEQITDKKVEQKNVPVKHLGTYIADLTVNDLSVWNDTTKSWEDLNDETKWNLEVRNDEENKDWGFRLTYLEEGEYSYDMHLYLNKVPDSQTKTSALKSNAMFNIQATVYNEVNTPSLNLSVNTGRTLRIRKLFPYEQKESYVVSNDNRVMIFKPANYIHYKNQLHLEDLIIYNKTAGRFEDILDQDLFEVRFKDDKAVSRGTETQKTITRCVISEPGDSFVDGMVWCWNEEYDVHVFAYITSDFFNGGSLKTIKPIHFYNAPKEDMSLEFRVLQFATLSDIQEGLAIIEFQTKEVEVYGDGWLHNVINPLAPLSKEIMIIPRYDIEDDMEYEVSISKSSKSWIFIRDKWEIFPKFHLDGYRVPADRLYIMTDTGRFPLVNPSTGKPSMQISYTDDGMDVTFLNLYQKYDHFEVHTTPYPMRSVYTQRRVPENGFIDLKGRINKPLNKKYFEFWMNGRLLDDEVTIISPTKLFLHGLKSLRNFEIIEINRDPNEYFSDIFLDVERNAYGSPYPIWNFTTYLDAALTGTLEGDNYSLSEQEALLSPIWKQVDRTDPNYKDYPVNQDLENDILLRIDEYQDMSEMTAVPYQFAIIDLPNIEGVTITGRSLTWGQFGFIPMSRQMIVEMLNEEWKDEIESGTAESHEVVSDEDWYGMAARLYDEYGVLVHNLNEAAYKIVDDNLLKINTNSKLGRIVRNPIEYDLS